MLLMATAGFHRRESQDLRLRPCGIPGKAAELSGDGSMTRSTDALIHTAGTMLPYMCSERPRHGTNSSSSCRFLSVDGGEFLF